VLRPNDVSSFHSAELAERGYESVDSEETSGHHSADMCTSNQSVTQ